MRNFLLGTIILFCSSVYSFAETKMSFALDWKFEGPSAPYFYAIDQGFFKAEGIEVEISPGKGSLDAIPKVATGAFPIGFADINSVVKFIDKNPDACHPIVRNIIKGSRKFTAADAFKAIYKTAEIKQITQKFWSQNDVLITPTVGALYTKKICESDPLGPNFKNGTYTNFANLLGLNALAIPFGKFLFFILCPYLSALFASE